MPETELKFLISEADVEKLRALSAFRASPGRVEAQHSETVYFDTAAQDLWKLGFTLRTRRIGEHLIQTLKQTRPSLIERGEWEGELAAPPTGGAARPDLSLIEQTPLADVMDERVLSDLRPSFEIDVERITLRWSAGRTLIEIAIDQGFVREVGAQGQIARISEVELELKQGDRRVAFALARTLAAQVPLQLSLVSKAERGQRLLARAVTRPSKSSDPHLSGDMTIGEAFAAICRACIHDFMLNAAALEGEDAVEAIHQGRIALRRLRAALALFQPAIGDGGARIKDQLKWLADIFGAARDSDVLREQDGWPLEMWPPPDALREWREARRRATHEAVRSAIGSKRLAIFLIDLVEWIETSEPRRARSHDRSQSMPRFVRQRLKARRNALIRPLRDLARLDPDARHRLRIRAKKLRYMAQFFIGVPTVCDPEQLKRLVRRLDRLQTSLGELHDEDARRGVAEAELQLSRDAGVPRSALSGPRDPLEPFSANAEALGRAIEAYGKLARLDPF